MPPSSRGPATLLAVLAMLATTALVVIQTGTAHPDRPQPPRATPLFVASSRCSHGGDPALRARQLIGAANANLERAAFSASTGRAALTALSEATLCLRTSQDFAQSERVATRLADLRTEFETTYHAHQVRLRLALDAGQLQEAGREARALLAFLGALDDAYTRWLQRIVESLP